MTHLLTKDEFRKLEALIGANDSDAVIRKAAKALVSVCKLAVDTEDPILLLCGKGNNAADGLYAVPLLCKEGYDVSVALLYPEEEMSTFARKGLNALPPNVTVYPKEKALDAVRQHFHLLDCVYGIGFHGTVPEDIAPIFSEANRRFVIACDIPSGVACDTGDADPYAIQAKITVSMLGYKPSFVLPKTRKYYGKCNPYDLGVTPDQWYKLAPHIFVTEPENGYYTVKKRPEEGHKGTFGTLQAVCGSADMPGAGILAAMGALRSGVGLVQLATDDKAKAVQQMHLTEPVWVTPAKISPRATAVLYGCGLGNNQPYLERYLLCDLPLVLDADGLNALAGRAEWLKQRKAPTVITPHPGEFARLCGKTVAEVERDRFTLAQNFAMEYGVTVVLKGQFTLIARPNGRIDVNQTGNTALSKGGSGDVLAGVIGSLLAQGYEAEQAATLGAMVHGLAAEYLCKTTAEEAVLPSDLPPVIGKILGLMRRGEKI